MSLKLLPSVRRLTAAAIAITAATAMAASVQPATAAPSGGGQSCSIVQHRNTQGVVKVGAATATLAANGIKLTTSTTSDADKVTWKTTFNRSVRANTVKEISYETIKLDVAGPNVNDAALPSYHIFVRTNAGEGVLIYEPYWYLSTLGYTPQRQIRTEWNVLTGKLWTSSPVGRINGLPPTAGGPPEKTFAEVVTANPGMTVTGIGFGLGTYNRGVIAILDEQRFATSSDCTEHQWSTSFNR